MMLSTNPAGSSRKQVDSNWKLSPAVGEDDSTDVGYSSSDVDTSTFNSPCCTDTEMEKVRSCEVVARARLQKPPGLASPTKKVATPAIFATECVDNSGCNAQPKYRKDIFRAPPGLASPVRRRRTRTANEFQSMLATLPSPGSEVTRFPPSPNRRARVATMERAKRDGLPLKVEPQFAHDFATVPLNPALPAKKKLPFVMDVTFSDQSMRKLKPGVPAKKHVSPWLLQSVESIVKVMPR